MGYLKSIAGGTIKDTAETELNIKYALAVAGLGEEIEWMAVEHLGLGFSWTGLW